MDESIITKTVHDGDEMLLVWRVGEFADTRNQLNLALTSVVMRIGCEHSLGYKEQDECVKEFVHESD